MKDPDGRKVILILGIMTFWCNGENYAAAPLLVEIAREFHVNISQAALSVTSYMLPFGLFTIIFGPLADRYGKARVINFAAFGSAIFCALAATAPGLLSLCVLRAVNGAFAAAILPVTMSLVGDRFSREPGKVQHALGKVFGIMFLGGACATAIGGALSYFGSWRLVYLFYGLAELVTALVMLKTLDKSPGTVARFSLRDAYREAFANADLVKTVSIVFLVGGSVFGSFAYAGQFVQATTGYNLFEVGLILTFFGLATVVGGRKTARLRQKLGNRLLLYAGIFGALSWALMGVSHSPIFISLSLTGFGLGFIMIHPSLVATAQQLMPGRRGTVMSLVSFNLFVGGGLGTLVNGKILDNWGFGAVFLLAAVLLLLAGFIGSIVLQRQSGRSVSTALPVIES
ncbi:MAG: MFS transporter [Syntrophobacteraceae bacterium]|nr:MFS transporter [Syntrophobacteraceae bacterium]